MKRKFGVWLAAAMMAASFSVCGMVGFAAEGQEVIEAAEGNLAVIGQNMAVITEEGGYSYFTLKPSVSGVYTIYSTLPSGGDPQAYLYDADGYVVESDDDGNGNLNFKITKKMYAGETYYLGVKYYDENTGTIPFTIEVAPALSSMKVLSNPTDPTFTPTENPNFEGTVLELTFDDGSTEQIQLDRYGNAVDSDRYLSYNGMKDLNGNYVDYDYVPGTYIAEFTCEDVTVNIELQYVTVTGMKVAANPADTTFSSNKRPSFEGTVLELSLSNGTTQQITLNRDGNAVNSNRSVSYNLLTADGNYVYYYEDTFVPGTYFAAFRCEGQEARIELQYVAVIDMKVVTNPADTTFSSQEGLSFEGTVLELTLSNGKTQQIHLNENGNAMDSSYDVYWTMLTADGKAASYGVYEAGSYIAELTCEGKSVRIPVQCVDWRGMEAEVPEIAANENVKAKLETSEKDYFYKFIPEETGTYVFHGVSASSKAESLRAVLYSADGKWLSSGYGSQFSQFSIERKLTGGVPYYLVLRHDSAFSKGTVTFRVDLDTETCGIFHTWKTVVDKAATCVDEGSQHKECSVCGLKKAATVIPATGEHTYGAYKTTKEATVLAEGTKVRTCSVCGVKETASIKKLTATIKAAKSSLTVYVGKSVAAPKITVGKGDAVKSYKSSKPSVATVNSKGKITGRKAGTANILVTLKSGKTTKIKVTVKKIATTKVAVNKKSVTLKKGKTLQLKVTVTPKDSQDKLTYKTSNAKVATVSSKGKITAKAAGTATITITSGTKKVTCKVTVK
ncbi:MAG: Ig-like domain-containing protein [Eubacteriales bacterium]|nr:Ig-like domain-containing protein [Eubacteriales bacterium]